MSAVEEAIQAIRQFSFWNYGMDEVDPTSEFAEWVPDLASAVLARVLAPDEETVERVARTVGEAHQIHVGNDGQEYCTCGEREADMSERIEDLGPHDVRAVLAALAEDPAVTS